MQVETAQITYGEAPHLHGDGRQDRVLARAGDVLVDVIGDPDFLPATVTALRAQGRDCYVLLADCDPAECRRRVMQRALGNGRFVPVELVDAKVGVPDTALAPPSPPVSSPGGRASTPSINPVVSSTETGLSLERPMSVMMALPPARAAHPRLRNGAVGASWTLGVSPRGMPRSVLRGAYDGGGRSEDVPT